MNKTKNEVIYSLECCKDIHKSGRWASGCSFCFYRNIGNPECVLQLMDDAKQMLKEQPQWHPFNPLEPDDTGLKDHNFYLVTVKGFGTPMKAMYHIDKPFGFAPPPTKEFDPYDVVAWCELPDNMDEGVKQ